MHCLTVGETHYAQPAPSGFLYSGPAADAAISLFAFVLRMLDYPSNPGFLDADAVAVTSDDVKVFRCLHFDIHNA